MKILIADTDEISKELLKRMLENWGHEVVEKSSGVEIWRALSTGRYPMAIFETVLPEMNGLDICEKIRAEMIDTYVYIILLTAKESQLDINRGLSAGADDYIKKPFDVLELHSRVHTGVRIQNLELKLHEKIKELNNVNNMLIAAYRDIRQMKDKLKEEIEITNRPMFVINPDLKIDAVNLAAMDLLAKERKELLGGSILDQLAVESQPEFRKNIDIARLGSAFMQGFVFQSGPEYPFQVNIVRLDSGERLKYVLILSKE